MNTYRLTDPRILEGRYWPSVEACYSRTWDHYTMPPHYHSRAEIMYVLKGECLIHLYDYRTEPGDQRIVITRRWTERLRSGEFIWLDQEVLHDLEVPESGYMLNAEFSVRRSEDALLSLAALADASRATRAMLTDGRRIRRGVDRAGQVLHALERVVAAFSRPGDAALLDVLMAELILRVADIAQNDGVSASVRSYVQQAIDYIADNLCSDLRVASVAGAVNIAPAYLQRIFKQTMQVTLVEYINQQRVEQSKRLLMYTDDAIVDVAIASGFNSRQHFYRVFNEAANMSPQQFRREHRAQSLPQTFLFDNVENHSYDENGYRQP